MLRRKTNFSFSAKSGRGHPPQSDLAEGCTDKADPAAMSVDLTCSDPLNEPIELSSELADIFRSERQACAH